MRQSPSKSCDHNAAPAWSVSKSPSPDPYPHFRPGRYYTGTPGPLGMGPSIQNLLETDAIRYQTMWLVMHVTRPCPYPDAKTPGSERAARQPSSNAEQCLGGHDNIIRLPYVAELGRRRLLCVHSRPCTRQHVCAHLRASLRGCTITANQGTLLPVRASWHGVLDLIPHGTGNNQECPWQLITLGGQPPRN